VVKKAGRLLTVCGGGDNGRRTSVDIKVDEEARMPNIVRVNLANPAELLELPGVGPEQATAILNFRVQHGPIQDAAQLATILHPWPVAETLWERVDFAPAEATAPEAPGA
jgi:DNA uptake protein ComE-like DNA-binding protein